MKIEGAARQHAEAGANGAPRFAKHGDAAVFAAGTEMALPVVSRGGKGPSARSKA